MRRTNLTVTATADRLILAGRFDAHEADEVATHLATRTTAGAVVELAMDEVRYLDGAALALLDRHRRELADAGGELRIAAASPAATIIMDLAHRAGIVDALVAVPATADLAVAA